MVNGRGRVKSVVWTVGWGSVSVESGGKADKFVAYPFFFGEERSFPYGLFHICPLLFSDSFKNASDW